VINIETLKWSKLIKRTLKKTEGRRMKLKTLQDVVFFLHLATRLKSLSKQSSFTAR
jgi:hypothetical protein